MGPEAAALKWDGWLTLAAITLSWTNSKYSSNLKNREMSRHSHLTETSGRHFTRWIWYQRSRSQARQIAARPETGRTARDHGGSLTSQAES